jgi:hypothetical protein
MVMVRLLATAVILPAAFYLAACGGGGGGGNGGTSETIQAEAAAGAATLSWTPPTTKTDGTALDDLAGYTIYYGETEGNYTHEINITNPGIATFVVEHLQTGTYYFVITAYNLAGNESKKSNVASTFIN